MLGAMSRRLMVSFVVLATCSPSGAAEDDPVLAWRRRLADPAAFPVRAGMKIEEAALLGAALQARAEHGERLARRWDAELRGLGESRAPAAPDYRTVLEVQVPTEPLARSAELVMQLADRGLVGTLRRTLSMHLPLAMSRETGAAPADMGKWLGFLSLAEPEVLRCGAEALCMSYGGLDVFVFTLGLHEGSAVVEGFRWLQRATP